MTALERVEAEAGRLVEIGKRRALWEDEKLELDVLTRVGAWIRDERQAAQAAVDAAREAKEQEESRAKKVFDSYREHLKKEGRAKA